MRKGLLVLVLSATALAGAEEEIGKIFAEPASLPGKLNFAAYSKLLAEKGYPKSRASADDLRSEVASYFGQMLSAPCVVRRLRVAEDGASAVAVVDLGGWLLRWFLVKEGRWWYADFEDVKRAVRFSDWDHLPDSFRKAYDTEDDEEAVRLLRKLPEGKRAPTVEAARLARLAYCLWMVDREKEALRCCEEASAQCDAPVIELWRAYAATGASEPELAVKAANAYLDAVGEDAEGCYELGRALRSLERGPEAVAAHLRGIKADPTDGDNVLGLLRALPEEGKAAAAEHFLRLRPLDEWFAYLYAGPLLRSEAFADVRARHAEKPK